MSEKLQYPERIISISDCHGGHETWNPLASPDPVEQLTQSIRSDFPETTRFDNFGAPSGYLRYIVAAALRLHTDHKPQRRTGLFINSAPRTTQGQNGQGFYRAEFGDSGLVVVSTPLEVLSKVKGHISALYRLPNKDNGLYSNREQHRSSYTPRLLADNHGLDLEQVSPNNLPELDESLHCELSYVDRFGNLVLTGIGSQIDEIRSKIEANHGKELSLSITEANKSQNPISLQVVHSLAEAIPGKLSIYPNDNDIEILRKWQPSETPAQCLEKSAWSQFNKPQIGSNAQLEPK